MSTSSRRARPPAARVQPRVLEGDSGAEPGLFEALREDFALFAELKGSRFPSLGAVIDALLMPGIMATIVFRLAHKLNRAGLRPLSRLLYIWNIVAFGCDIAPAARIGPGFVLPHPVGFGCGKDVVIGRHVRVMGLVRIGGGGKEDPAEDGMPTVGDECWLLDGCKLFGRIEIGDRTIVAAGAIVLDSVPEGVIVAGSPAKVVKHRPRGGRE